MTDNERVQGLQRGEVHIWHGSVPDAEGLTNGDRPQGLAMLSADELHRQARLVSPLARSRFAAAHGAVRQVLGDYLGIHPAEIRLGRAPCCRCGSDAHGRPTVTWPVTQLNHNVSNSGGHWLLALAHGCQVGVDIEAHRAVNLDRMAATYLSDAERAFLASQPRAARVPTFFRCWTRKEAALKACGVGIMTRLSGVEVHLQSQPAALVDHQSGTCPGTWLVRDLQVAGRMSAAIAVPARSVGPIRLFEFQLPG